MSFDYRACFTLGDKVDAISFRSTLDHFGLRFAGATEGLVYDRGRIASRGGSQLDQLQFIANANLAKPSATARLDGEDFFFELGVLSLSEQTDFSMPSESTRIGWLEISDQNLQDMAFALEDRNSDSLRLLVGLFKALNANSMAMGVETTALQFMQFFAGALPLPEIDARIWTTIQPPATTLRALLGNPSRRELTIDGTTVITGSFPGAEDYFD